MRYATNQPSLNLNSSENHTKYLPIMSKVSYKYRTTDTSDPVTYPNFEIVNENNLVGFLITIFIQQQIAVHLVKLHHQPA